MKTPVLLALAGAFALACAACDRNGTGAESDAAAPGAPAPAAVEEELTVYEATDMFASQVCVREVPPDAVCLMDINACGFSSGCGCDEGYSYNAAVGKCLLDLETAGGEATFVELEADECVHPAVGACTRDINACGQPSRCGCDDGFIWNDVVGMCLRDLRAN